MLQFMPLKMRAQDSPSSNVCMYMCCRCSSEVGYQGRLQYISLGDGCWYVGTAAHEIGKFAALRLKGFLISYVHIYQSLDMLNGSVNENRSIKFLYRQLYSFLSNEWQLRNQAQFSLGTQFLFKNVQEQQPKQRKRDHMQFFAAED